MKKISVVIPVYNEQESIRDCMESLFKQDYPDFEVIIIDDGSTDQTVFILKNLQKIYPNLKVFKINHQGPAKARNYGVTKSDGEILVFMDADMTFSQNFLFELVEPINKGLSKGTFSKNEFVGNWDNIWARCWNINSNLPEKRMIPENYPNEGQDFRAILKSEFEKIKGFDDTGYSDTWTLSKKLEYSPQAVKGAKYFHNNPSSLREVFIQSKWVAKREYKLGVLGQLIALVRLSFPISLIVGTIKSIVYKEPKFLLFKMVFDLGGFLGILEKNLTGKLSK